MLEKTRGEHQSLKEAIVRNEETIRNIKQSIDAIKKFIEDKKDTPNQAKEQEEIVAQLEKRLRVISDSRTGIEKTAEILRNRVRPNVEQYMSQFCQSSH